MTRQNGKRLFPHPAKLSPENLFSERFLGKNYGEKLRSSRNGRGYYLLAMVFRGQSPAVIAVHDSGKSVREEKR
jgi:hypothetical protein